jgi:hypothetical protein
MKIEAKGFPQATLVAIITALVDQLGGKTRVTDEQFKAAQQKELHEIFIAEPPAIDLEVR